ncbi:THO complex subunit 4A-like isoform X1 [Carex littledalei]|uniref:THO complex subunit 4A-like isoform X1 n=1 Tax=Carex littledalei TaxID=544730 RepID=A0A833R4W6_9POAL|nr:THO complex subunit 4A-like isoform X1 [Carex littledalei]
MQELCYSIRASVPLHFSPLSLLNWKEREMANSLDMSLDDLIRQSRKPPSSAASPGGRVGGRRDTAGGSSDLRGASGPARLIPKWRTDRLSPYSQFQKAPDTLWEHDLYTEEEMGDMVGPVVAAAPVAERSLAIELGTKLLVSNLDYGVSNEDIQELFSEVGGIRRYSINYDKSGRSKGTAEVVFARYADALAAVKRYDGVLLDEKPMKIEIVGTHFPAPPPLVPHVVAPLPFAGGFGNLNANASTSGGSLSGGGGFGAGVRGRGGGGGGNFRGGRGGGASKGKRKEQVLVSADDLDADLEKYRASGRYAS